MAIALLLEKAAQNVVNLKYVGLDKEIFFFFVQGIGEVVENIC